MKYCLWPWCHLYYNTDKGVYPCCKLANIEKFKLGNTNDSIDDLWNSNKLKKLRKDFIENNPPQECFDMCINNNNPYNIYIPENHLERKKEYYENTDLDGTFKKNFIIYNMAASNFCNFKCAYCSINYSNRFYDDRHILNILGGPLLTDKNKIAYTDKKLFLKLFEEQIPHLEKIYFSSGESHLQEIYYDMLDLLISKKRLDINIEFITNLSGFEFKKRNILDLLKQFTNITLVASVDCMGKREEYIRYGTKWYDIEKNREEILKYPTIKFLLQPVVTSFSLFSLPDFHFDWYKKGFINNDNIRYIILENPKEMRINNIPKSLKLKIENKLELYINTLKNEKNTQANKMTPYEKVKLILEIMRCSPTISTEQLQFFIMKHNITRNIKFKDVFIEFNDFIL